MAEVQKQLVMSFDPKTIDHLGVKMYSQLPNAMAELIANAYDADAGLVTIYLWDGVDKSISVEDDGLGMTFDELNRKFLRIGRNRREEGETMTPGGRIATGKKGLGKLAFFGIGDVIQVTTKRGGQSVQFQMAWEELKSTSSGQDYKPEFKTSACDPSEHGTTVTLNSLKRKSNFDPSGLSKSLAKLFHFPDEAFRVRIVHNDGDAIKIDNKLKYEDIEEEFDWDFPDFLSTTGIDYEHKGEVCGRIVTAYKPLNAEMRGITLFANGRMVNAAEFFGRSESSHFFSYATGWLDVDFVDNWDIDVISTNRQSIDWEHDATQKLREFLREVLAAVQRSWRERRKEKREETVTKGKDYSIPDWFSKLPPEIEEKVSTVVKKVVDDSELSAEDQGAVVEALHSLVPEYPRYHWRHLHSQIQDAAQTDYENQDYYRAFQEGVKRYISKVREKSGSTAETDSSMMGTVFGRGKPLLVTRGFTRPDGNDFPTSTTDSIEDGQKYMSMGVVAGCRNPLAHEEISDLRESGLFTEKDCLDALSILSHLMTRLDAT
ncbi:MAG TPA: TIGR02391 family protein [Bacteroidia bacterium]|nr:TIGR02391 family protein [Bacteroidia bacterium]